MSFSNKFWFVDPIIAQGSCYINVPLWKPPELSSGNTYSKRARRNQGLTSAEKAGIVEKQNKAGWMHPPHPQHSEGVNTAVSALGTGRICLCGCGSIRIFVLCRVYLGKMLKEVSRLLAL